jgi:hypothetical protein
MSDVFISDTQPVEESSWGGVEYPRRVFATKYADIACEAIPCVWC